MRPKTIYDLVVSHGGSGSVLGTLAHGLPSLLLPMGADQPWNADQCRILGVARVLDVMTVTPVMIRDTAANILADSEFKNDARVHYWKPAKWTAKLRAMKTDNNLLLLKTNMGAGHGARQGDMII